MHYRGANLDNLILHKGKWFSRSCDLVSSIDMFSFVNGKSREFAVHGFNRRIIGLRHCIARVFEIIPPDARYPSRDDLMDVTAFIHAFYINTYGAIDNLALVLVSERRIQHSNGRPLKPSEIGLTRKYKFVRRALPQDLKEYVQSCDEWLTYFEEYRHALAHRIPLYIPRRVLRGDVLDQYNCLISDAEVAVNDGRYVDGVELQSQASNLGCFEPYIVHSFEERAKPVIFHAQMINDLATVVEMAEKVFHFLNDPAAEGS